MLLILIANGLIWLKSNLSKIPPDRFIGSLSATLERFASKNPYPWYKDFLESVAIPNSQVFGFLTFWGELFTALAIIFPSLYLLRNRKKNTIALIFLMLGLIGGMFLNIIFWLASGWTSPSTDSLNLLMFGSEFIGFICIFKLLRK